MEFDTQKRNVELLYIVWTLFNTRLDVMRTTPGQRTSNLHLPMGVFASSMVFDREVQRFLFLEQRP